MSYLYNYENIPSAPEMDTDINKYIVIDSGIIFIEIIPSYDTISIIETLKKEDYDDYYSK